MQRLLRHVRSVPKTEVATLFDHLVGTDEKCRRNVDAERLRDLEVDHEFRLGWVLCGQIGGRILLSVGEVEAKQIHHPIMELSPEDRRDLGKVNEAVRRYREKSEAGLEYQPSDPAIACRNSWLRYCPGEISNQRLQARKKLLCSAKPSR